MIPTTPITPSAASDRTLDAYKLTRITDGDTPFIEMPIRMLSMDTPEVHYPGTMKPSEHDAALAELGKRLLAGKYPTIPRELAKHLGDRLDDRAGTRQLEQGERSMQEYQRMLAERMKTPSGRGMRRLFVRSSAEVFEAHGRLLGYVAPTFDPEERAAMSLYDRRTFNFQLVEEGWAAPFLIYPSLPKKADLDLFHAAVKKARVEKRGNRKDHRTLHGYEFRFCVKLMRGEAALPERSCADLRTSKLYKPEHYLAVKEEDRLFVWPRDVSKAKGALGLKDA
jgi:endonuclease YncB( thermonuclease family)